jgi:diaminohydroxyphosphoribosylaminopyrimidine deaminase/5-amino-6-(5-phosphoribosylamino)uracil reductase
VVAAAGLARVVIGSEDPIAGHRGGMAYLKKHGMTVTRALVDECDHANLPFMRWAQSRQPAFTLKAAITIDGKIATVTGESKWITGEPARTQVHQLRNTHDAVLVGIETVLADDPKLTARIEGARDPVRVVVDSKLRTPPSAKLLPRKTGVRTIIATTESAAAAAEAALVRAGAEVWRFHAERGRVPLHALASRLGEEGILSVLVEGGGQIHASLLAAGLATDVQLFLAPLIVGGPAPSWVGGAGVSKLSAAWRLQFIGAPQRIGDDLLIQAAVVYKPGRSGL